MEIKEALDSLKKEYEAATGQLKDLLDKQDEQIKSQGGTLSETSKAISSIEERLERISEDFKSVQGQVEEMERQKKRPGIEPESKDSPTKSVGQLFVESPQFKAMKESGNRTSAPMVLPNLFTGYKALVGDDSTAAQYFPVEAFREPGIVGPPERQARIRDLLTVRTTGSNAIEYVQETGFGEFDSYDGGVTPDKRGHARSVAEGDAKPRVALTFSLESEAVRTLAHWLPASRQVLDDETQLRAYIDNRMVYGVKVEEDRQILYGDRASGELHGLMRHATVYDWASEGEATDTAIDGIRRAMTVARIAEFPVNGCVLHPNTWETIELLKDNENRYIWVQVSEGGQPRLWRVPVVDTTAIGENDVLVGAFGLGAFLWDREQAGVRVAEQHEDFFVKNMVVILAEERLALTVFRPEAFVTLDLDSPPAS